MMQFWPQDKQENEQHSSQKKSMVMTPPYVLCNRDYKIIFVNEAYERKFGAEPGSLNGRFLSEIIPENTLNEIKAGCMKATPDDPVIMLQLMSRTKEKRSNWASITMFSNEEVSCRHILGFSDELLHINDSSSLFQQLIEKLPISIYTMSKDKYQYVNPQHCLTYGYSQEEIADKKFIDLVAPESQSKTWERMSAIWNNEPFEPSYEIETVTKDGRNITLQLFHILMDYDQGQFVLAAGIDNTARKKAEDELIQIKNDLERRVEIRTAELKQANQNLKLLYTEVEDIYQSISDGIMVLQKKSGVVMINNALRGMLGNNLNIFQKHIENVFQLKNNLYFEQLVNKGERFQNIEMTFALGKTNLRFFVSGSVVNVEQGKSDRVVLVFKPAEVVQNLVNRLSGARAMMEFDDIITMDKQMLEVIYEAKVAAKTASNILIQGESGTGKEIFAQAIHNFSDRRNGPFVAINCGALPRELLGSELFGYEGGSFTGAKAGGKPGKFEFASGGTLFLDEIGDMPLEQQVALLRVLQEKSVMRIGSNTIIPVDVRIICATNKDLEQEMISGNFRRDLYYRINVINLNIPPLRERVEDISLLFDSLLNKNSKGFNMPLSVEKEIYDILKRYSWPGNVRELQNVVERTINSCNGVEIAVRDLPKKITERQDGLLNEWHENNNREFTDLNNIKNMLEKEERKKLIDLFIKHRGNITRVAKELGIARSTVYRKIKQYGIDKATDMQL